QFWKRASRSAGAKTRYSLGRAVMRGMPKKWRHGVVALLAFLSLRFQKANARNAKPQRRQFWKRASSSAGATRYSLGRAVVRAMAATTKSAFLAPRLA